MSPPQTRCLLLLSCSNAKREGGQPFAPSARKISDSLSNETRIALYKQRNRVRSLLRGEGGRLYNEDQKGGFRDERPCNAEIAQGPDFGGAAEGNYLPACQRYNGRFFARLNREAPTFWKDLRVDRIEIVFLSALYGLLFWDELIQNYDCHFSDLAQSHETTKEHALFEKWRDVLTKSLRDLIKESRNSTPITAIYDLLSEEEYQKAIMWRDIENSGVEVRHRLFRHINGPDILAGLGGLVAKNSDRFVPGVTEEFETQQWYDFGVNGAIRFESELLGEMEILRRELLESHGWLKNTPEETCNDFALAEALWKKVRRSKNIPYRSIVIAYATAVEGYFRFNDHRLAKMMLGNLARRRNEIGIPDSVAEHLDKLTELRNQAAHRDPKELTREDTEQARNISFEIVNALQSQ
jgi:hypothetical protein